MGWVAGFDSRQCKIILFSTASRPVLGLTQPPVQWVPRALHPVIKRQGREVHHSPPSSAELKKSRAIPPLPRMSPWCSALTNYAHGQLYLLPSLYLRHILGFRHQTVKYVVRKFADSFFNTRWEPNTDHTRDLVEHTGEFSSVRLPAQGLTFPQRCFRQTIVSELVSCYDRMLDEIYRAERSAAFRRWIGFFGGGGGGGF
jgi:hypothetical protein